ncbi:hypothetical protein SteCoe_35192 [Stentor coeruleus]|uniref:Uncharacterized protein n=1 Tax=Stentor coeruleus TaxID=5963 RepID=A0A1R2AT06_9CILI|nr:hypothetical protein SteCoe_35192 [Stentor coeruleus]
MEKPIWDKTPLHSLRSKHQLSLKKSSSTFSLPLLKNPNQEKIDNLLSTDREKFQKKINSNYYPHNISYLKEQSQHPHSQGSIPSILPTEIVDIYNKIYSTHEKTFEFLRSQKIKRPKSPQLSLIEKVLEPEKNNENDVLAHVQMTAPTSRQEAVNLKIWFEMMENKYCQLFRELIGGKADVDREKVMKAWKAVYLMGFQEVERQIAVQCTERGQVLSRIISGYDKLYEYTYIKSSVDLQKNIEHYSKEMSEIRISHAKQMAFLQVKIESLEKEKATLRYNQGQSLIKIRELERIIDEMHKSEKSTLRGGTKNSTFKHQNTSNEESPIAEQEQVKILDINEKLVKDIDKKLEKLADVKKKLKDKIEKLKDVNIELSDKQCDLAKLNFETELRQVGFGEFRDIGNKEERAKKIDLDTIKVTKFTPKGFFSLKTPRGKKHETPAAKKRNDGLTDCQRFFTAILEKSKDRLENKTKVSQEHIFQSLNVIYHRAIIQIELAYEVQDLQHLVYKQFVKNDITQRGEKKLKNFIGGCLKLSDFRRVSVFLRLMNLGYFINCTNFSTKALQVYLSAMLYMENSQIGLLVHKNKASSMQYYPVSRALACLHELQSALSPEDKESLEKYVHYNNIKDPKNINPLGLIELEAFLEKIAEKTTIVSGN